MNPTYKVIVLGDSNVGKTCVIHRFCQQVYNMFNTATILMDIYSKTINLSGGIEISLQIWDTVGQERFRSITTSYYRGAMGILLIYDVTNMQSFRRVPDWFECVRENAPSNVMVVLLGNKCDSSNRVIESDMGEKMAENFQVPFFEVSSKMDININEAFLTLGEQMHKHFRKTGQENITLSEETTENNNCQC
ncbi:Ras family [Popillia japonica]|uniref:Ras family n=1 Tax=Popillia japonica TaxID=7064 RepID=A0AAW1MD14_POPJA